MKTETQDPVCGMSVEQPALLHEQYKDVEYPFCSERCHRRFQADPEEFVDQADQPSQPKASVKRREKGRGAKWTDYVPLAVVVGLTLAAASAKQAGYLDGWDWTTWMHDFMGFFLVVFSMFKFFNLEGFADGFQMYDLLAKPFRPYAYVYPWLELSLGLGYLSQWRPEAIYSATIALTCFGALGVFRALAKGLDVECACMGTILKVPLSTVAAVEDLGMAAMATAMLLML